MLQRKQEYAYLIGITSPLQKRWEALESFEELQSLTRTSGSIEMGRGMVDVRQIQPGFFIGKGKVDQIKSILLNSKINLVVIDSNLSPTQNRNLEEAWGVRVIDRTSLILDIFALHAKSKEGKLQVELAQYEYLYPRLVGQWTHFSKQRGGGVGLRGPGETQLEVDRRRVRDRMVYLKNSLEKVESSREIHRKHRADVPIPTVTLVGYTNAGKSTLFNAITHSSQLAEDKLFATLDPKTKRITLPSGREVLLTDTVGFIRKLPHQLVEAFKSTFEEARGSDLLLHVVDGSHTNYRHQVEVVEEVLEDLDLHRLPMIKVMNKMDSEYFQFQGNGSGVQAISVSATTGIGVSKLLKEVDELLSHTLKSMKLFLKHPYGSLLSSLYSHGRIFQSRDLAEGVEVEVELPEKWQRKFEAYAI